MCGIDEPKENTNKGKDGVGG